MELPQRLTFEDELGFVARHVQRLLRPIRWWLKGVLRLERKILVEIRWRLGDEIMALPIYNAIKEKYADTTVELLCIYPELLEGNSAIDSLNPAGSNPDKYIFLRSGPRDVRRIIHYATLAGVAVPYHRTTVTLRADVSAFISKIHRGDGPLVAFACGASWETKRWPADSWRDVGERLIAKGCRVIELGDEGESIGVGTSFAGQTSVAEAAALLAHADLAVTNDSGLMHLSLAVGTPVVALFGPTEPSILIGNDPKFHPVGNARECAGCWNVSMTMQNPGVCPLDIEGCMATLNAAEVLSRVEEILDSLDG